MKQLVLSLLLAGVSSLTFAQVDYSKLKPDNPYSRYEYKSGEEWRAIRQQELAAEEANIEESQETTEQLVL